MGMKKRRRRLPELNPETVARAKEKSTYAWAIWCDRELDFFQDANDVPALFMGQLGARERLLLYRHTDRCDHVVQVKVIVDPAPKKRKRKS